MLPKQTKEHTNLLKFDISVAAKKPEARED